MADSNVSRHIAANIYLPLNFVVNVHNVAITTPLSTEYKVLLLTYKCCNGLAPEYLASKLIWYKPNRNLRSEDMLLLVERKCKMKMYGERAFSDIAPKLWNNLPINIRKCHSVNSFKTNLKTFLFREAFQLNST